MTKRPGRYAFKIGAWLFGVEHSTVVVGGERYLSRWILYLGRGGLRLHKFYRGDDDRAPHNHPFWFITMPFTSYTENVYRYTGLLLGGGDATPLWFPITECVRAWRFHRRGPQFKHIVVGRTDGKKKPFWTFVIFGMLPGNSGQWGFFPAPGEYVPFQEWHAQRPADGYANKGEIV